MQNSSKKNLKLYTIIFIWFISVVTGLVYFQLSSIRTFDPQQKMLENDWFEDFKTLTHWQNPSDATLTIVIDSECGCSKRSAEHVKQLASLADTYDVKVTVLDAAKMSKELLPNVPGAVLIDSVGSLAYAGPLSEGIACSSSSGFIELVMNNLQSGFNSNLTVTQAQGCYCRGS
ncbi:DUF6436 domain-containing protein [Pseudoalteromonas sp. H105]|uniref:DUF6436 domain-containing protein n=1 Tax=Pseudoalteromonas sp. H105 TaxID=1348393 RepID=UPI0007322BFB|nr:DUF6436 domain-containing protein [Pseudoalteromonas sp. H105]KTF16650.1 hypothetical protein ATS75_04155 [Pseudoalteromonas sp. H105]